MVTQICFLGGGGNNIYDRFPDLIFFLHICEKSSLKLDMLHFREVSKYFNFILFSVEPYKTF